MKKHLFLHIGTHKTGSTSLQQFLLDHVDYLRQHGIDFYRGQFQANNHIELHLASMRYDRDSFAKQGICKHIQFDEHFTQQVADRVQGFIRSNSLPHVLFTSEGLSLLRHDDEIERLRMVLDRNNAEITVILYLRDKDAFLRSYRNQLHKIKGRTPATEYWSALYVEPDTWLTDYEALIAKYQSGFGASNVVVIDYDAEMKKEGNIIPSFLKVLGFCATDELNVSMYFRNVTKEPAAHKGAESGLSVRQIWRRWANGRAA